MEKSDRNKGDRNKSGDKNTDDRYKVNSKIKEWPGTRKGAKTRYIRYIRGEDRGDNSDKDGVKKQNQAKADGGIKKGGINDTGVKDGKEQQNQDTGSNNGFKEPVITNEEENPAEKVTKTLAKKLAKDLGEMVNKNLTRSGPCSGRPVPGTLPMEHRNEEKAKEDTETYEEATNTLSRLLNKYGEGKNRYQNLHRMINTKTYLIKRAGQGEKVQKKAKGDTERNNNLQVEKKREEGENAEGPHDDALLLCQLGENLGVEGQPFSASARLDVLCHLPELWVLLGGELHHLLGDVRG